jgi:hypothetical protein
MEDLKHTDRKLSKKVTIMHIQLSPARKVKSKHSTLNPSLKINLDSMNVPKRKSTMLVVRKNVNEYLKYIVKRSIQVLYLRYLNCKC